MVPVSNRICSLYIHVILKNEISALKFEHALQTVLKVLISSHRKHIDWLNRDFHTYR